MEQRVDTGSPCNATAGLRDSYRSCSAEGDNDSVDEPGSTAAIAGFGPVERELENTHKQAPHVMHGFISLMAPCKKNASNHIVR